MLLNVYIKPDTRGQRVYDSIYTRHLEQSNSKKVKRERWLQGWGTGDGESQLEKLLELDNGDVCTTVCRYLPALNCKAKTVKMVHFMLCIFYPPPLPHTLWCFYLLFNIILKETLLGGAGWTGQGRAMGEKWGQL